MTSLPSLAALGLGLALVLGPPAAGAQPAGKVATIGFLSATTAAATRTQDEALARGLGDLGYVEGRHFRVERRYADGNSRLLPRLAADLVRRNVDVIVAPASTAALAAKQQTSSIPIVFASANDPVGLGLVASLARPGANVTGLTPMSADLSAKRLQLLKEAVPTASRIAILSVGSYPAQGRQAMLGDLEASARRLRLDLRVVDTEGRDGLERAFTTVANERVDAVTALPLPFLTGERRRIAELALKHRLPSVFHWREYAEVGGLMSYGANRVDLIRRAATYVDKILKGARPGELPVEQATTFELVVNLKTARALGLTIPPSILTRADQVIE